MKTALKKYKLISPWSEHQGEIIHANYKVNLATLTDVEAKKLLDLGFKGVVVSSKKEDETPPEEVV